MVNTVTFGEDLTVIDDRRVSLASSEAAVSAESASEAGSAARFGVGPHCGAGLRVGRLIGRPQSGRWVWDGEMFAMLGRSVDTGPASIGLLLSHVADDDQEVLTTAFRAAVEEWRPFLLPCRLRVRDGSSRSVLVMVELMESEPTGFSMADLVHVDGLQSASGPWLSGCVIDLTELHASAAQVETQLAVIEATRHRAVIEQAKGMVMMACRVDADTAFALLSRRSQDSNTKLHDLAAQVVAERTVPAGLAERSAKAQVRQPSGGSLV